MKTAFHHETTGRGMSEMPLAPSGDQDRASGPPVSLPFPMPPRAGDHIDAAMDVIVILRDTVTGRA